MTPPPIDSRPAKRLRLSSTLALAACVLACLVVGAGGAFASAHGVPTWYRTIPKPPWTPPDGVFGPVWTVLYIAMGVAVWRIWRRPASPSRRRALVLFGVQLALNAAWSPVFFALERPAAALVVIVALDLALGLTIRAFRRVDRVGAWILGPYLAWCLFATALNAAIVRLAA